jgi:HPr kinase/phosphorylase
MPEMEAYAAQYDVNVFATEVDTSEFFAQLISTLANYLAPRETVHGVLVEVHGEGVLITGESGIGKSETALELIKRGHRLIADDAVEIKRISRNMLTGQAPDVIRYYLEIRGIGVVNVCYLYGIGAVKPIEHIDMVINLELWDDNKFYDRLGLETEFTTILDVKVPYMTIPVRPGRNLAVVIELAAMNNRHKKMGFNAAMELANAHDLAIDQGTLK